MSACDRATPEVESPRPGQQVVVRSFTDASSVRDIVTVPPHVFAGTDAGLDRWNLDRGERVSLELDDEIARGTVRALAGDPGNGALWIATETVVGRYGIEDDEWRQLPEVPAAELGGASLELAAAGDGVWLGGDFGLVYADLEGSWSMTDVGSPVTALHADGGGALWVGTERGLLTMSAEGELERIDGESCAIGSVRMLAASRGGGVLSVGDAPGGQRIAVVERGACRRFRASPDVRWLDVASSGDLVAVLTEGGLYATFRGLRGARQLDRDGMRLLALAGEGRALAADYRFRSARVDLPIGTRSLGLAGDEILAGTDELGIARVALDRPGSVRWLRRRSLVADGSGLTVQCRAPNDCVLATGASRLWRFDGERIRAEAETERAILAVVPSPRGDIYALRRGEEAGTIEVAARGDDGLTTIEGLVIEVPGLRPELSFARLSPTGTLWLGLRYLDDDGAVRPYGVALVDVSLGIVAYHRATMDATDLDSGVLPIPINASDVSFAGAEAWLATSEGAAAVRADGEVELYTEAHGLRSELLRGIAVNPGGMVFVATRAGVGYYDGEAWRFPRLLRGSVRGLEFADDGRLWMATDRGLAAYDGKRVRRLDERRGLLEDTLRDLAIDDYGRIWVRGQEGITVVAP